MSPLLRCLGFGASFALCLLVFMVASPAADARSFSVSIRVSCPQSMTATGVFDPTFTIVSQRPCAGIRVSAMDADPLWDEFCGAAYTDSRGFAVFDAECGDAINSDPEVFARIEGRSINGFSVGVPDFSLWQRIRDSVSAALTAGGTMPLYVVNALREHRTMQWLTPESRGTSGSIDLGSWQIGGSTADGTLSTMAARQFWAAQFTMFRLNRGTRYRPMDFNYTVAAFLPFPNPPLPIPSPSQAFTAYDTVLIRAAETATPEPALVATAHEIGHVLYNTYHSGMLHWLYEDVTDYMTNHARCDTNHFQTLAWYEGFADFIRDYTYQMWDQSSWNWTAPFRPNFAVCTRTTAMGMIIPLPGMHIEGNVQAMLNTVFFGPIGPGLARPQEAQFTCPAGQTRDVNATGVVQCLTTATCTEGRLSVDHASDGDRCIVLVPDPRPRCSVGNTFCEPVDQAVAIHCASGSPLPRPGPDACVSPATHTIAAGTPQPRPDGTPDMTIGLDSSGAPAWFTLADLDDVIEWVRAAGTDGHRAREYWTNWIRPWCLVADGTWSRYCDPTQSPTFLGQLRTLDPGLM
jgi:hypothetical protein